MIKKFGENDFDRRLVDTGRPLMREYAGCFTANDFFLVKNVWHGVSTFQIIQCLRTVIFGLIRLKVAARLTECMLSKQPIKSSNVVFS